MNKPVLFSTGCPRCVLLERHMTRYAVEYEKTTDFTEITAQGFMSVPILKVDDKYMTYEQAYEWIDDNYR